MLGSRLGPRRVAKAFGLRAQAPVTDLLQSFLPPRVEPPVRREGAPSRLPALTLLLACSGDRTLLHVAPTRTAQPVAGDLGPVDAGAGALPPADPPDTSPRPGEPITAEAEAWVLPEGLRGLPAELQLGEAYRLAPAFPHLEFHDPVALEAVPRSNTLVVAERQGRLYAFENDPEAAERRLVLDLFDRTQGENDSGLLGVAFHPEFGLPGSENRGYVYVHYAFRSEPLRTPPPHTTLTYSRLSRFSLDPETLTAEPDSELILIDQRDQSLWHQGGALLFRPDGFLYVSVGDEGSGRCRYDNCQRIDRDLFSGVLRLDVDRRGGAVSHPIGRQPATGQTQGYYIPSDNPFVGAENALEEFYAVGLRSPHRMTYDPVDDLVWIGEVGQEGREEIDVLLAGANYQWAAREGFLDRGPIPTDPLGIWTDPLIDFSRREMLAIIGGYVYRGARLPELWGKYLFADFSRGSVLALSYERVGGHVVATGTDRLLSSGYQDYARGISSFGRAPDGELFVLTLGDRARVLTLARSERTPNAPGRLSETGVFQAATAGRLDRTQVAAGLRGYAVRSPLWSDGAVKSRWLGLPPAAAMRPRAEGPWQFPRGSVFVKHFEMALDEAEPALHTPIETRILVAGNRDYYGLTYRWNEEGTDATLVTESENLELRIDTAEGAPRLQSYLLPSPSECRRCHSAESGQVLGVRAYQLTAPEGSAEAQSADPRRALLRTWHEAGLLGAEPRLDELSAAPALSPLSDERASLEHRVRSYWASNCSMCHGALPSIRARWDARFETPLAEQGVIGAAPRGELLEGAPFLITPGEPETSLLFLRDESEQPGLRMPPLATSRPDQTYLDVLARFIESLPRSALDAGAPPNAIAPRGDAGGPPEGDAGLTPSPAPDSTPGDL